MEFITLVSLEGPFIVTARSIRKLDVKGKYRSTSSIHTYPVAGSSSSSFSAFHLTFKVKSKPGLFFPYKLSNFAISNL